MIALLFGLMSFAGAAPRIVAGDVTPSEPRVSEASAAASEEMVAATQAATTQGSGAQAASGAPREVVRPTAPLTADPENIPELKRRIEADQEVVRTARTALKRARKRKDIAAESKAKEEWRKAKEQLKSDRNVLRKAIVAGEEEESERLRLRRESLRRERLKP